MAIIEHRYYVEHLLAIIKNPEAKDFELSVAEKDILSYVDRLEKIVVAFAIRICDVDV